MHPLRLSRADVLSGEGCGCGADGVKGTHGEQAHLAARGHGRHGGSAQPVDGGLEQNTADGGDGVLHPHGQSHSQQAHQIAALRAKLLPAHFQHREMPHHIPQAQQPGDQLAEQRGPSGPGHAHFQPHNEGQVQHHIQQAGKDQKIQRRPGIPQRADNAGEQVVQHGGRNAQKDQENVIIGVGKGIRRIAHPDQDSPAAQGGHQGDHPGEKHRQPDHIAHKFPQALKIPLAEFLSHGDGEAGADAVAQADHQKVHRAGGADSR